VDRGTLSGVQRGMGVVTPDGIVGKVIAAYPTASEVLLVTDADFAAGVVSQKNQAHGTLKGQGTPLCKMDYVALEEKIEPGELLFTSGDDRIFPRGFPVGQVKSVRSAQPFKEIQVEPFGLQRGLEDVLIVVQGAHQAIPELEPVLQPVYIAPAPPATSATEPGQPVEAAPPPAGTEADRLRAIYKAAADAQNHKFGEGGPGIKLPDFTKLPASGAPANPAPAAGGATPANPANPVPAVKPPGAATPGAAPEAGKKANPPAGTPPGGPPR